MIDNAIQGAKTPTEPTNIKLKIKTNRKGKLSLIIDAILPILFYYGIQKRKNYEKTE